MECISDIHVLQIGSPPTGNKNLRNFLLCEVGVQVTVCVGGEGGSVGGRETSHAGDYRSLRSASDILLLHVRVHSTLHPSLFNYRTSRCTVTRYVGMGFISGVIRGGESNNSVEGGSVLCEV